MGRFVIATPTGQAWVDLDLVGGQRLLVIGHGAGGSVESPDLLAVRDACLQGGISLARVTQPYRVAGKKAPPAAAVLDRAWAAVVTNLGRRKRLAGLDFVYGGRSSGARVACRAAADDAVLPRPIAVVALAFPVHPPGQPDKLRTAELDAVPVPVLVVQGDHDPFGMPGQQRGRTIVVVPGDHALKRQTALVGSTVVDWLLELS
jgi:predicted alpha/beta-hydrolase family hydrolase